MAETATGVGLARMNAILRQFDYMLEQLAGIKDYDKRQRYLEVIREKHIRAFEFYGVPAGSRKAKELLRVEIDWDKHNELMVRMPKITINDLWEENVSPDIRYEVRSFRDTCAARKLKIDWCFWWSDAGRKIEGELDKKLGTHTIPKGESIQPPDAKPSSYSLDIQELSAHTSSDQ